MAAPVVPVDINPDALAALDVVPPAAPPAPVAVDGGGQGAPAPKPEVCSFEFSSATLLVFVDQVSYRLFYIWSWFFCCL